MLVLCYVHVSADCTVERRRRDNINEQIQELAALVPNSLLGLNASIQSPRTDNGVPTTAPQKPNKGMVLRKSVEYIQMLKSLLEEKTEREQLMGKLQVNLTDCRNRNSTPWRPYSAREEADYEFVMA